METEVEMFKTAPHRAVTLLERWRTRSLATVWPGSALDWHAPAVDAVCEALTSRARLVSLDASCRSLGEHRALLGVELEDARADAEIATDLIDPGTRTRSGMIDAVTVGWANFTVDRLIASTGADPLTEYATLAYLSARLEEIYAEAHITGEAVDRTHVIVAVGTERVPDRLITQTRMITLQSALRYAFIGGESLVSVSNTRAAALALRQEPRLSDSLAVLRSELRIAEGEYRLPSSRLWLIKLPSARQELPTTLRDLLS